MKEKVKLFIIFLGCILFRLLPLRAPNVEPLMSSIMPISKKYGPFLSFFFGFFSIFFYDILTNFGSWTFTVGITYGFVGLVSYYYFSKYKASIKNFVIFSSFATIAFDLITGVMFAPMFGQSYLGAFTLQIPFTILHLVGNIGFALTISPILNFWLTEESFSFSKEKMKLIFIK